MDQEGIGRLPLEICQAIWEECLPVPATSSELYFYNRDDFGPTQASAGDDKPGGYARFKVVIEYPVVLHVCHEAREYAWKSHGISFQQFPRRERHIRGRPAISHVLMPCRPYLPETDVFVYSEDNISDLWEVSDRQLNDPTGVFRGIRHFALGSWQLVHIHAFRHWLGLLGTLPALRNVSIIFGYYWGFQPESRKGRDMCEFRHFNLAPFTEETAWMHPDCENQYDPEAPEFNEIKVRDVLAQLKEQLSTTEILDMDNAPRNEKLGGWLFGFSAERMFSNAVEFRRASRRYEQHDGHLPVTVYECSA